MGIEKPASNGSFGNDPGATVELSLKGGASSADRKLASGMRSSHQDLKIS